MPAPSTEELLRLTQERLEAGEDIAPRGFEPAPAGSKGASWIGQGSAFYNNVAPPYNSGLTVPNFNGLDTVLKGEYYQFQKNATPTYGCNADGSNIGNRIINGQPNAIEDTIAQFNLSELGAANQAISYVLEGMSKTNWFNTQGGGNGNNPRCAIYQLWATQRSAVAANFETLPAVQFAEISFRSNLTQYGKGPGQGLPGGTGTLCYIAPPEVPQGVKGYFWKVFNKNNTATPNMTPVRNYDILIAPAGPAMGVGAPGTDYVSADGSKVETQAFYFGGVSLCYGGASIIGLSSTTSSCTTFKNLFTSNPGFFYNPVYGPALAQWQRMAPANAMDKPWKGPLGAPVFGPTAYKSGQATSEPGKKWYAWGWYFEKGFMWFVDNDQVQFPNSPDEAHVYTYSGSNTYCTGGTYTLQNPKTFFLGQNATTFRVNVAVTGYSGDNTAFLSPFYNATLNRYQIPMSAVPPLPGTDERVYISASASGYGGTPDPATCTYQSYVWAWRDGTVTGPFDGTLGMNQTHQYLGPKPGTPGVNKQSIYVIRVQVQDSLGALAYGDSVPMELGGTPGGAGGGDILVVRNDGGAFNTNYNAIKADLDSLKSAFPALTYTEQTYGGANSGASWVTNTAKNYKIVIWYHGGPESAGGTDQNIAYTVGETTDMVAIMNSPNPRPILQFSQNVAVVGGGSWGWYEGFELNYPQMNAAAAPGWPGGNNAWYLAISGNNAFLDPYGVYEPVSGRRASYTATNPVVQFTGSTTMGERYSGTNASGKIPTAHADIVAHQINLAFRQYFSGSGIQYGVQLSDGVMSWGNSTATVKNWIVGYPWAAFAPTAGSPSIPTRANVLHNLLAGLDATVPPTAAGGPPPFASYSGVPEILQVTPIQFLNAGGAPNVGNNSVTGTNYPDTTAVAGKQQNVLRSSVVANTIQTTVAGNDGLNGNDIQFQHPFYAYIIDPDSSVTTGVPKRLSNDETVTFGGLLLQNNGMWTRINPASGGYVNFDTLQANKTPTPVPPTSRLAASGYYVAGAGANFTGTTRAFYGGGIADLQFNNANGPVTMEAIAHWATTLQYAAGTPATVYWKMWPGDAVLDANSGGNYGQGANRASNFFNEVDIDPSVTPEYTGRATSSAYNTSAFVNGNGVGSGGRVHEFTFSRLRGWDGDLDHDGNRGETVDDKFPVQARIFSNYSLYTQYITPGTQRFFPDNTPDPTSFVEGGAYLADNGPVVTGITVADDGVSGNDPNTQVTIIAGPPLSWMINLFFRVNNSLTPPDFTVEANFNYPAGAWKNISGSVTPDLTNDGVKQAMNIAVSQADIGGASGNRTVAIRATDSGGTSNVFIWPNQVAFNPPFLFQEDFNAALSGAKWQTSIAGMTPPGPWIQSSTGYAQRTGPNSPPDSYYLPRAVNPQEGSGMLRWTQEGPNSIFTGPSYTQIKSVNLTSVAGRSYAFSFYTAGQSYWGSGSMLFFAVSYDGGSTWQTPTFTTGTQSAGQFGYYVSPTTFGFSNLTSPYEIWESSAGGAPPYYGFGSNTSTPRGDWQQRAGTFVTPGTQCMIAFAWSGYMYMGPGVAIDNILIQ